MKKNVFHSTITKERRRIPTDSKRILRPKCAKKDVSISSTILEFILDDSNAIMLISNVPTITISETENIAISNSLSVLLHLL